MPDMGVNFSLTFGFEHALYTCKKVQGGLLRARVVAEMAMDVEDFDSLNWVNLVSVLTAFNSKSRIYRTHLQGKLLI